MRISKNKILYCVAVAFFVFVFLNDTTVYNVYFDDISNIILLFSVFWAVLYFAISKKIRYDNKYILFSIIWLFFTLIPCFIAGITKMYYIRVCYWMLTFIFVMGLNSNKIELKRVIYDVCKIFCIWCLMCYFYTSLDLSFLPVTHTSSTLAYNWYTVKLYGFFISNNISHISLPGMPSIYRLDRPFGEPGIAQIFMNYGIIYNLFFINKNERQRKWIILFVIGSILSFSLIGYLILLFIIFLKLFREKKYGMCLVCIVPAVIIGSIMVIQKMTTLSYNDRVNDYSFMFETIVENFPFGIGIGHTGELEHTILENDSTSIGFYCGVLYPLAQYGIFGLIYYWALFKGIHNIINNQTRYEKKFSNIIFAIFIVLTLLTEPQADEPLILCFIFDGLQRYFNTKKGMEVRNDFNYMSSNG